MATTPRPPPRFVPTLTDVVRAPPAAQKTAPAATALATAAVPAAVPAARTVAPPAVAGIARLAAPPAKPGLSTPSLDKLEDQLVRRVMARVDATLDQRLREATARVVMEQTRALGPALRREIEQAVRLTVAQSLADDSDAVDTQPAPGP